MGLIIQKFGGTTIGTLDGRKAVFNRVSKAKKYGHDVVVVVSAMGRRGDPYATDTLIDLVKSHCDKVSGQNLDLIMSCGEIISAVLMASYLESMGIKAMALTGFQAGILTTAEFGDADVLKVDTKLLHKVIRRGIVPIVAGFQGQTDKGDITTLGRGGSDTTAIVLGNYLGAGTVEIYTDVPGVAVIDPRIVPETIFLDSISFDKMLLLTQNGSKVVHHKAVKAAMEFDLPFKVKSAFKEGETLICSESKDNEPPAIAVQEDMIIVTLIKTAGSLGPHEVLAKQLGCGELVLHFNKKEMAILVSKENIYKAANLANDLKADLRLTEKVTKISLIYRDDEPMKKNIERVLSSLNIPVATQKQLPGHYLVIVPSERSGDIVKFVYKNLFTDIKCKAV
jgi:aspartate kinase